MGPEAPFADAATARRIDPLSLFQAAVAQDVERLDDIARGVGDTRGILGGLAPLIAMPLLQACRRAWTDQTPGTWPHGYCPTCGAWPTLAEIRGLDGARHLRCRCCGGDWATEWLRCPFCGERDHTQLGSLISAEGLEREKIEVCDRCDGYLKTITTFAPIRARAGGAARSRHGRPGRGRGRARLPAPESRGPMAVRIVARRSGLRALLSR